jgi:uncharacterized protein YyaL (SSP411 family)
LRDPRIAELEDVAARAVAAVAGDEPVSAAVAMFLLRHYLATDAPALGEALGLALAQALALAGGETSVIGRAEWLTLLVEATAVADDERIVPAVVELVAALRATWPAGTRVDEGSASVDACLRAASLLDRGELVQDAIDHLERVVGGSYRPGDGLMLTRGGIHTRGSFDDHVRGASALLTAFEITGRLPYSMLAEELIAIAGHEPSPDANLVIACEAARVLCRLAALHDDPEYRGAAVIATGADYRAQASRILAAQSARARAGTPSAAAAYGLALRDLLGNVR